MGYEDYEEIQRSENLQKQVKELAEESMKKAVNSVRNKMDGKKAALLSKGDLITPDDVVGDLSAFLDYHTTSAHEEYYDYAIIREVTVKESTYSFKKEETYGPEKIGRSDKPVTYTESQCWKVVKRGYGDEVHKKEAEFCSTYKPYLAFYNEVKSGTKETKLPGKALTFAYDLFSVIFTVAVLFFVFAIPTYFGGDASKFEGDFADSYIYMADYYLFRLIPDYNTLFPKSVSLMMIGIVTALFVIEIMLSVKMDSYAHIAKGFAYPVIIYLLSMASFGFVALLDFWSVFPPFIFTVNAARIVVLLWAGVDLLCSTIRLLTSGTYMKLKREVNARLKFINEGTYDKMDKLLNEILSCSVLQAKDYII